MVLVKYKGTVQRLFLSRNGEQRAVINAGSKGEGRVSNPICFSRTRLRGLSHCFPVFLLNNLQHTIRHHPKVETMMRISYLQSRNNKEPSGVKIKTK